MYKEPCMCGATDCTRCFPGCDKGVECDDCREMSEPTEMKNVYNVGSVCPDCYDNYETCPRCEERFHDDDMKMNKNGEKYCYECVEEVLTAYKNPTKSKGQGSEE